MTKKQKAMKWLFAGGLPKTVFNFVCFCCKKENEQKVKKVTRFGLPVSIPATDSKFVDGP